MSQKEIQVGDIIQVCNPLLKLEYSFYYVTRIEGNKAFTGFRNFNIKVYNKNKVYEYGKRLSAVYNNTYIVHSKRNSIKELIEIIKKEN